MLISLSSQASDLEIYVEHILPSHSGKNAPLYTSPEFFLFFFETFLSREGGVIVSSLIIGSMLLTAKSTVMYFTNTLGLSFHLEIFH